MTIAAPAAELVPLAPTGRRFTASWPVRLSDVDPRGRMRLDAIARHLQDVAADDAADSGLDGATGWIVRRTLIDVRQHAMLGEHLRLTTFCSGSGRSWAERRTSVAGDAGAAVEAVSLWVQIDLASGRPTALTDDFHKIYGPAAGGRRVSTRLRLGGPPDKATVRRWPVRAVDLDVFGHVNNASHWPILEEALVDAPRRVGIAEMEYLLPIDPDHDATLHHDATTGIRAWLVVGGRVHTAARWTPVTAGGPR